MKILNCKFQNDMQSFPHFAFFILQFSIVAQLIKPFQNTEIDKKGLIPLANFFRGKLI
jgi:hypothetical protein